MEYAIIQTILAKQTLANAWDNIKMINKQNNMILYPGVKIPSIHDQFIRPTITSYEIMNLHSFVSDELGDGSPELVTEKTEQPLYTVEK